MWHEITMTHYDCIVIPHDCQQTEHLSEMTTGVSAHTARHMLYRYRKDKPMYAYLQQHAHTHTDGVTSLANVAWAMPSGQHVGYAAACCSGTLLQ